MNIRENLHRMFQMNIESHRHPTSIQQDDERSEGELDSSSMSDTDEDDEPIVSPSLASQPQQISQSWTNMLTEQKLSSIMTNALADNSEIIHIDDPIAQQGSNPLTYVFPPGTNPEEYFERKQKHEKLNRKSTRRDLKNLSHLLNHERNLELLRMILNTIGCRRAFQYAHDAVRSYQSNSNSDDGQTRTLGGFYFRMFLNDQDHQLLTADEREQIRQCNQRIQKAKKKKLKKKKKKATNWIVYFLLHLYRLMIDHWFLFSDFISSRCI